MNIFYVYPDPADAAICLPDKLVVKMPLESAQMLSTAHRVLNHILCEAPIDIPDIGLTTMPQAMPDEYKNSDPVKAYRDYVVNEKHYAQWNKIPDRQPTWWQSAS